jgi:hypothetical protein
MIVQIIMAHIDTRYDAVDDDPEARNDTPLSLFCHYVHLWWVSMIPIILLIGILLLAPIVARFFMH